MNRTVDREGSEANLMQGRTMLIAREIAKHHGLNVQRYPEQQARLSKLIVPPYRNIELTIRLKQEAHAHTVWCVVFPGVGAELHGL